MVAQNKPTPQNGAEFCWLPGAANQRYTSSTSFRSERLSQTNKQTKNQHQILVRMNSEKGHLFTVCESVN